MKRWLGFGSVSNRFRGGPSFGSSLISVSIIDVFLDEIEDKIRLIDLKREFGILGF